MDLTAPGVDAELERRLGAERFAAIAVGRRRVHPLLLRGPGRAGGGPRGLARHPAPGRGPEAAAGPLRLGAAGGAANPDVDPPEAGAAAGRARDRRLHDARGARRRRLLRLHPRVRPDPGHRDRRRLRPRPARGAPGARRLHGAAHGGRARLQDRADRRAAEPHHPRVAPDDPLRVALLRRDRGRRQRHVRQRRAPASRCTSTAGSVTPLIQTGLVLGPTPNATYTPRLPAARARRRAAAVHGRHGRGPRRRRRRVRRRAADAGLPRDSRPALRRDRARAHPAASASGRGGGEPEDDRTVVVLKRHFGPAPAADEKRPTGSAPTLPGIGPG